MYTARKRSLRRSGHSSKTHQPRTKLRDHDYYHANHHRYRRLRKYELHRCLVRCQGWLPCHLEQLQGPATLATAVSKLGPLARAATVEDAVRESDVVSVSIPLTSIKDLPIEALAGKIVIDTTNYYPERDGNIEELDTFQLSTSELVQRTLKGSRVVKAFHNISQFHFRFGPRPVNDPERWALPIAGDDADAKAFVMKFVSEIGFDPVDCGTLAESWRIQQHSPCYFHPFVGDIPSGATRDELFEWVKRDHSRVVKEADVRDAAAKATKSGRAGQLYSDWPPEFEKLFSIKLNEF